MFFFVFNFSLENISHIVFPGVQNPIFSKFYFIKITNTIERDMRNGKFSTVDK